MFGCNGNVEDSLEAELGRITGARQNKHQLDQEREFNICRSGSAPPTVQGSLNAINSLFRTSNCSGINIIAESRGGNVNPGPPLLSPEDWCAAKGFHGGGGGGIGNSLGQCGELSRKTLVGDGGGSSSLFSVQPVGLVQNAETDVMRVRSASACNLADQASLLDRGFNGLTGWQTAGIGARRKSFADILQEGLDRSSSFHNARPAGYNAFGDIQETNVINDFNCRELSNIVESLESSSSRATISGLVGSHGNLGSQAFASGLGSSLSRGSTLKNQFIGISPLSGFPLVGDGSIDGKIAIAATMQNGHSASMTALDKIASLSGLLADKDSCIRSNLHSNLENDPSLVCRMANFRKNSLQQLLAERPTVDNLSCSTNLVDVPMADLLLNLNALQVDSSGEVCVPRKNFSAASLLSSIVEDQNAISSSSEYVGCLPHSSSVNQRLNRGLKTQHPPAIEPYSGRTSDYSTRAGTSSCAPQVTMKFGSSIDLNDIQKAYLETLIAQQNQLGEHALPGKFGCLNKGHRRKAHSGLDMHSLGKSNPIVSANFTNEDLMAFATQIGKYRGGSTELRQSDMDINVEKRKVSPLLHEFKTNKTRSFELSDIVDHVVEFSMDQYGSRFIQQKLEAATNDTEKEKIFLEIIPHARTLMKDVFGNYVIQKFFEHGTESQKAELVSQLTGHVLPLSLQMYGCRVIQKALEVVGVDEQTRVMAELDGSVLKCVKDQNGNHVIQKCIECLPEEQIQFIISAFYGQVVPLSTHPYGCRVIQRILEHCKHSRMRQIILDEIMQSVCTLAQDQYGNYVIQHVLEHGKAQERSAIISKLAGQIVRMSQQKFASNVVEKCLTYGGREERQLLVNEMLGNMDENEPLQAMMKDPYGNYVVQKVLETCSNESLELILSRIKVHLNALKRYTYGKHIVARVEKLIMTGERRKGLLSSLSS